MIINTRGIFKDFPEFKLQLKRHDDFSAFYQVILENTYNELFKNINYGDIIIDAGANIGAFTVPAAKLVGNNGKIISIEPQKINFSILKGNIELNKLNNVILVNKAIYNKSDEDVNISGEGVFTKLDKDKKDNFVKTITLNDIVEQYKIEPKIMKMDIEGSELYAMQQAEKTLKSLKYIEMGIHNKYADNEVNIVLKEFTKIYKNAEINNYREIIKKHLFYFFNLELHNRFKTSFRILKKKDNIKMDDYPKIGYFYRK
ncbi:FkbM family methyltransferase [Acidiplasma aeolicum]|jgi:FkbM family methyltransferase|uniref:FkbM family methyltransferase n=1 Tax=Acidiplasma aeolicum TaxID=507754 RepID=UPI00371CFB83